MGLLRGHSKGQGGAHKAVSVREGIKGCDGGKVRVGEGAQHEWPAQHEHNEAEGDLPQPLATSKEAAREGHTWQSCD